MKEATKKASGSGKDTKRLQTAPKKSSGSGKDAKPLPSALKKLTGASKMAAARKLLRKNTIIESEKQQYRVLFALGSGGFGDVYRVKQENTNKEAALKTEMLEVIDPELQRLHNELQILAKCNEAPPERRKHFLALLDRGKVADIKFIVMELCSLSLEDVRRRCLPVPSYSQSTAMQIAKQALQAIWDLHDVGYLHRDIKPGNFAVGLGENETRIYMLDFGIGRRWREEKGGVRPARTVCKFFGTVRFASRACHSNKEQSQKDDLESWIYMTMDLIDDGALEWRSVKDKDVVKGMKQKFFEGKSPFQTFKNAPEALQKKIGAYVDKLKYGEIPDYKKIQDQLMAIADDRKINMNEPFDWIGKILPEHIMAPPKPKQKETTKEKTAAEDATSKEPEPEPEVDPFKHVGYVKCAWKTTAQSKQAPQGKK